jgi:hypothetical protein
LQNQRHGHFRAQRFWLFNTGRANFLDANGGEQSLYKQQGRLQDDYHPAPPLLEQYFAGVRPRIDCVLAVRASAHQEVLLPRHHYNGVMAMRQAG